MTLCSFNVGSHEACRFGNAESATGSEPDFPDALHTMNQVQKP
jgi:hypothetical protein